MTDQRLQVRLDDLCLPQSVRIYSPRVSLTKRKNKMNGDGRRYGGAGRQVETLGRVWLHINVKAELRWSAETAVAYPVRFKYLRTKSHGLCGNSLCGR